MQPGLLSGLKHTARQAFYASANLAVSVRPIDRRPILVIGNGRSGTSWIGETLAQAPGTIYYREPCHPSRHGLRGDAAEAIWSQYVPPDGADQYFEKTLGRSFDGLFLTGTGNLHAVRERLLHRPRIVIKEVSAYASLAWILCKWNPTVLIIVRHPCAYALSVGKLGQDAAEVLRFERLRSNPQLQRDRLAPLMKHLDTLCTPLEATVGSWAIRNYVNLREGSKPAESHIVVYEDVARDPLLRFNELYALLGLEWDVSIANWIEAKTSATSNGAFTTSRVSKARIDAWRSELSQDQIATIRRVIEPFELPIYNSPEDW